MKKIIATFVVLTLFCSTFFMGCSTLIDPYCSDKLLIPYDNDYIYGITFLTSYFDEWEVVGNIHNNLELLEVSNENTAEN